MSRPPTELAGVPGVHAVTVESESGRPVRVRCEVDQAALDQAIRRLTDAGLKSLVSRPPTLEELFLRHYRAA